MKLDRDEETVARLAILLSIFEPLLINDQNLERAIETHVISLLVQLLELPSEIGSSGENAKIPLYIKYSIRCLTSCVRHP